MDDAQHRKKGKKRKASSGEHFAEAEDVAKQSAGITNILTRYRSTRNGPSEVPAQEGGLAAVAAAGPSNHEPADAVPHRPDSGAEGPEDAPAASKIPESTHETAEQHHDIRGHLPASQSSSSQNANEPEEEGEHRSKHRSKQKQPKQASDAVLPWMRLPVSITAGQGVQLGDVGGLDPRLRDKMHAGQFIHGNIATPIPLLLRLYMCQRDRVSDCPACLPMPL